LFVAVFLVVVLFRLVVREEVFFLGGEAGALSTASSSSAGAGVAGGSFDS